MKTLISVKADSQIKKKAAKLAAQLGLSLSDIINVSLAQFVQTKTLHVGAGEKPEPALQKVMARATANLKSGKVSKPFDDADKAVRYLGL
jgi:addiction module RelB/DinJ family antitoxin